jgi:hypothetical protein
MLFVYRQQSIFTLALHTGDPAAILHDVNDILRMQEPGTYVSAIVGFFDADASTMRYATAGHPPPIVAYRAGEREPELPTGGPMLGVVEDALAGEAALNRAGSSLVGNTGIANPAAAVHEMVLGKNAPRDDAALLLFQFSPVVAHADRVEPLRPTANCSPIR